MTAVPNVAAAIEPVASHLHPEGSFDVADHPVPSGQEEVWRFAPRDRMADLLDGVPSDAKLKWELDPPAGVTVTAIATAELKAAGVVLPVDRLAALAVDRAGGATRIDIPAGLELAEPVYVHLTGSSAADVVWGNVLVTVGAQAKATILFEHTGAARYAGFTSVVVGDGAHLDLVTLELWDDDAVHTGQIGVRVGRDAHVRTFQGSLGGGVIRLVEAVEYAGDGGDVDMAGLAFVDAHQHVEHRLFVDHSKPHGRSNVDYRAALQGDGAHYIWIGDVLVRKTAGGIDTYETNRNLVLTDGCRADSVPNLEIQTGEIIGASHSSATGRFDDEQLFYLQARGIPNDEARRLVVYGFFAGLAGRIGVTEIRDRFMAAVERELATTAALPPASSGPTHVTSAAAQHGTAASNGSGPR